MPAGENVEEIDNHAYNVLKLGQSSGTFYPNQSFVTIHNSERTSVNTSPIIVVIILGHFWSAYP